MSFLTDPVLQKLVVFPAAATKDYEGGGSTAVRFQLLHTFLGSFQAMAQDARHLGDLKSCKLGLVE